MNRNDKNKKFIPLNINNVFKGKAVDTQSKTSFRPSGMQNIGKVSNMRRVPAPTWVPSIKAETGVSENRQVTNHQPGNWIGVDNESLLNKDKNQWSSKVSSNKPFFLMGQDSSDTAQDLKEVDVIKSKLDELRSRENTISASTLNRIDALSISKVSKGDIAATGWAAEDDEPNFDEKVEFSDDEKELPETESWFSPCQPFPAQSVAEQRNARNLEYCIAIERARQKKLGKEVTVDETHRETTSRNIVVEMGPPGGPPMMHMPPMMHPMMPMMSFTQPPPPFFLPLVHANVSLDQMADPRLMEKWVEFLRQQSRDGHKTHEEEVRWTPEKSCGDIQVLSRPTETKGNHGDISGTQENVVSCVEEKTAEDTSGKVETQDKRLESQEWSSSMDTEERCVGECGKRVVDTTKKYSNEKQKSYLSENGGNTRSNRSKYGGGKEYRGGKHNNGGERSRVTQGGEECWTDISVPYKVKEEKKSVGETTEATTSSSGTERSRAIKNNGDYKNQSGHQSDRVKNYTTTKITGDHICEEREDIVDNSERWRSTRPDNGSYNNTLSDNRSYKVRSTEMKQELSMGFAVTTRDNRHNNNYQNNRRGYSDQDYNYHDNVASNQEYNDNYYPIDKYPPEKHKIVKYPTENYHDERTKLPGGKDISYNEQSDNYTTRNYPKEGYHEKKYPPYNNEPTIHRSDKSDSPMYYPQEKNHRKKHLSDKSDSAIYPTNRNDSEKYPSDNYPQEKYQGKKYPSDKIDSGNYPQERYRGKKYPSDKNDPGKYPSDNYPQEKYDRKIYPSDKNDSGNYPQERYHGKKYNSDKNDPEMFPTDMNDSVMYPQEKYNGKKYPSDKNDPGKIPSEKSRGKKYSSDKNNPGMFPTDRNDSGMYSTDNYAQERYHGKKYPSYKNESEIYASDWNESGMYSTDNYPQGKYHEKKYPHYANNPERYPSDYYSSDKYYDPSVTKNPSQRNYAAEQFPVDKYPSRKPQPHQNSGGYSSTKNTKKQVKIDSAQWRTKDSKWREKVVTADDNNGHQTKTIGASNDQKPCSMAKEVMTDGVLPENVRRESGHGPWRSVHNTTSTSTTHRRQPIIDGEEDIVTSDGDNRDEEQSTMMMMTRRRRTREMREMREEDRGGEGGGRGAIGEFSPKFQP